jgi:hypothetical protein
MKIRKLETFGNEFVCFVCVTTAARRKAAVGIHQFRDVIA